MWTMTRSATQWTRSVSWWKCESLSLFLLSPGTIGVVHRYLSRHDAELEKLVELQTGRGRLTEHYRLQHGNKEDSLRLSTARERQLFETSGIGRLELCILKHVLRQGLILSSEIPQLTNEEGLKTFLWAVVLCVCVCVCVRACARVCTYMYVCMYVLVAVTQGVEWRGAILTQTITHEIQAKLVAN